MGFDSDAVELHLMQLAVLLEETVQQSIVL